MKENQLQLQQKQVEKLIELGANLQQIRQQQSVSLEEVAAKTRIQSRLLKAIEEGNLEQLPEPIYIKGFLKQFAEALGLNGVEFASAFPCSSHSMKFMTPAWQHFAVGQLRPFHLYLLYVVVVFGSVNGLSYLVNNSDPQTSSIQQAKQSPQQLQQQNAKAAPKNSNKLQSVSLNKPSKPVRVGVTLKASSWIKIVADGKTKFEGELPTGTQLTWVANEQLTVLAGNAGGVMVAFNEQKAQKLGAPGEVQTVTFEAEPRS